MSFKGQRLKASFFGLQVRTTLLLAGVVLAATAITGETSLRLSEELVKDQTARHATDMAKALAAAGGRAVQRDDRARLLNIAQEVIANEDLVYIIFTDLSGRWLACHQRGAGAIDPALFRDEEHFSVEPLNHPRLIENTPAGPHIDVVYPVMAADPIEIPDVPSRLDDAAPGLGNAVGPIGSSPATVMAASETPPPDPTNARILDGLRPTVGFIRIGLSLTTAEHGITGMARSIIGLSFGVALLMVPLSYQIVRHLVNPLDRMAQAASALAAGELDTHVPDERADEIGTLARAFNRMADQLSASHRRLTEQSQELERRVQERTRELEEANRQLTEVASRDSLTGLYNRRHFNEIMGQLFAESVRYETDLTCMMIDLDNLKTVNDTLGHQTGDRLIALTAQAIRQSIRESDIAIRYGGDEFAILLPRTRPEDARLSAERLLDRFRETILRELPEANIASLSIGLASRENDQPPSAQSLLHLADEALYLAKAGGKDRITVVRPAAGVA